MKIDIKEFIPQHSIDCVIFGFEEFELKVLLLKWKFGDFWTLPGGFVHIDKDLDKAALRVLKERTGLTNVYLNQFYTFGKPGRDKIKDKQLELIWKQEMNDNFNAEVVKWLDKRFITTCYFAMLDIREAKPKPDHLSKLCEWVSIKNIPELLYDHNAIVKKALEQLKIQLSYLPISINLLTEEFTMRQLQKLYEDILGTQLERSNFQRKMLKLGIFVRLGKKFSGSANKAPYLYKFDRDKYNELVKSGIGFID